MQLIQREIRINNQDLQLYIFKDAGDCMWFNAVDITDILHYKRPTNAIIRHVKFENRKLWKDIIGKRSSFGFEIVWDSRTLFVNEFGLCELLFGSKLKGTQMLKNWFFKEFLPLNRKMNSSIVEEDENALLTRLSQIKLIPSGSKRRRLDSKEYIDNKRLKIEIY